MKRGGIVANLREVRVLPNSGNVVPGPVSFRFGTGERNEGLTDQGGLDRPDTASAASRDMICENQVVPEAMMLLPRPGGKSHSGLENSRPDDRAAGADLLLHCISEAGNELNQ